MKRNPMIFFAIAGLSLPLVWLAVTTDLSEGLGSVLLLAGGAVTYAWLSRVLWKAHRRGRFAAHSCQTCSSPMSALPPGGLRPSRDTATVPRHTWVCRRCGRLV